MSTPRFITRAKVHLDLIQPRVERDPLEEGHALRPTICLDERLALSRDLAVVEPLLMPAPNQ
jgi:hypothetical protein